MSPGAWTCAAIIPAFLALVVVYICLARELWRDREWVMFAASLVPLWILICGVIFLSVMCYRELAQ